MSARAALFECPLRPLRTSPLCSPISRIVIKAPRHCHDVYNTVLLPYCFFSPSIFRRLEGLAIRGVGVG